MQVEDHSLRLLHRWFGKSKLTAQAEASERSREWCRAFDRWLAELQIKPSTYKQALQAWRRLIQQCQQPPWEIGPADLAQHTEWMQSKGYARRTIARSQRMLTRFYRWWDEQAPQAKPAKRSATVAQRPKIKTPAHKHIDQPASSRDHVYQSKKRNTEPPATEPAGNPTNLDEAIDQEKYAQSLPCSEVAALLAEGVQDLGEEIVGLRILARRLLGRRTQAAGQIEKVALLQAYTRAAHWLEMLIKIEKLQKSQAEDDQTDRVLRAICEMNEQNGKQVDLEAIKAQILAEISKPNASAVQLSEEVASMRLILRHTFHLAMENQDLRMQVRLTDLYGKACLQLCRLLKVEGRNNNRLQAYISQVIDQALNEVTSDLGLDRRELV